MSSDVLSAIGALIREEKRLIEALVAEGVPATDEHRPNEGL